MLHTLMRMAADTLNPTPDNTAAAAEAADAFGHADPDPGYAANALGHADPDPESESERLGLARPKILLDCDPGLDDAIAILAAAHFGDLVGITTVNGNVGIDQATHNALLVAQIADIDVAVHRGTARPLISPTMSAARVHGATGLGDVELPRLTRTAASADAISYICDTARSVPGLHLVSIGPLTNVALALRRDPSLPRHLAGITIMGGGVLGGNVTPAAEFNIWADPEAAAIVFKEAAPVTMVGLDITRQVLLGDAEIRYIRAAATPSAEFAAYLLAYAYNRYLRLGLSATPVHDATAVISVTHPHLFGQSRHPVTVELNGEHTRGMTVVDTRPSTVAATRTDAPSQPESDVVWTTQADEVVALIVEAVVSF